MNKKFGVMGIASLMLCAVAVSVFAAERVSYDSGSVTVYNTGRGTLPKVEVCVTLEDSRGRTSDTTWTFYNVGRSGKKQNAPGGTTVVGAFSTYCAAPVDDDDE